LIAALGFTGYEHEGYSFLNHQISELGMGSESPLAWVFNVGLLVSSPMLLVYILSTRAVLPSRIATIGRMIGIAADIGGFFVGIFPADVNPVAHNTSAIIFFIGGAVTVTILSVEIARQPEAKLGKWLCFIGFAVLACFAAYIVYVIAIPGPSLSTSTDFRALYALRPPVFWAVGFLEWLPLIGMLLWIFLAAIDTLRRDRLYIRRRIA